MLNNLSFREVVGGCVWCGEDVTGASVDVSIKQRTGGCVQSISTGSMFPRSGAISDVSCSVFFIGWLIFVQGGYFFKQNRELAV